MTKMKSLIGTDVDNVLIADLDAVEALYKPASGQNEMEIWNRKIDGMGGDDTIVRDRVGDYGPGFVGETFQYGVGGYRYVIDGSVGISDLQGVNTVDYTMSRGGLEIDLRPMGEAGANTYTEDLKDYFDLAQAGFARAFGSNLDVIYGQDFLTGIRNVIATTWGDRISGTGASNEIEALDGNDKVWGHGGDDVIDGGAGNDSLYGGAGEDYLVGGSGHDVIEGGTQDDMIFAGHGNDKVYGGDGADTINLGPGNNYARGGSGDDLIGAGTGRDTLYGDDGADNLIGGGGADKLYGGNHADTLNAGDGDDLLDGGIGTDLLYGGQGNDLLRGGANHDYMYGGDGEDILEVFGADKVANGGTGVDLVRQVHTKSIDWVVNLGAGGNGWMKDANGGNVTQLLSIEQVRTGAGDDKISFGGIFANKAYGMAGDDELSMGSGVDMAWGGHGNDKINGGGGDDQLFGGNGHDVIKGQSGADLILGNRGDDRLYGGTGNDKIYGGADSDLIRGGAGADELFGGSAADTFVWAKGDTGIDDVMDFVIGTDVIDVDGLLDQVPGGMFPDYTDHVFATQGSGDTVLLGTVDGDGFGSYFARLHGQSYGAVADALEDGTLFGLMPELPELSF